MYFAHAGHVHEAANKESIVPVVILIVLASLLVGLAIWHNRKRK